MVFVSVTRLRVRSVFYLPQFVVSALKIAVQAQRSAGFLGGNLLREAGDVFWTLTIWGDAAGMEAFRTAAAHGSVMPRLLDWCDEASVGHWTQDAADVPSWQEAHRRMVEEGRRSKVRHPSAAHLANQIPAPRPGRVQYALRPMNPA